jgi:hypothetical protein
MKKTGAAGSARERQVKKLLEAEGWTVTRGAGSHGCADLWAAKHSGWGKGPLIGSDGIERGHGETWTRLRLIQVKATAGGPYERFQPAERAELSSLAAQTGGRAELCWWPPHKPAVWLSQSDWPS